MLKKILPLAAGILATLTANMVFCGQALIRLAAWLSSLLLTVASHITMIPGAWQRCPTPSPAWVLGALLLLFSLEFFYFRYNLKRAIDLLFFK
jgi:hypothetical protein